MVRGAKGLAFYRRSAVSPAWAEAACVLRPTYPFVMCAGIIKGMKRLLWVLGMFLAAACVAPPVVTPAPTPAPSTPMPTVAPSPPSPPEPATLTLWLPDWMLLENRAAAALLQERIDIFAAEQGIAVTLLPKLPRGQAGLFDFLSVTYPVAPGLLPDLMALPFSDVGPATNAGFLQPLQGILPETLREPLFPAAQIVAVREQGWMAQPFLADFEHLAFQPAALSDPPVDWRILLESNTIYAFPTGSVESPLSDAIVLHYLSVLAGAEPRNEAALRTLLTFYANAGAGGRLDLAAPASSAGETWLRLQQGNVTLGHTTAHLWLSNPEQASVLRFGPVPTADSTPRYITRGWAFGIVTVDAQRQQRAAQLLAHLLAPDFLAQWAYTAHYLPADRATLARWPQSSFRTFAAEALENAILRPTWSNDPELARILQRAAQDVLRGMQPAAAAAAAAAAW